MSKTLSRPLKRLSKQLDRLEMAMALETSEDEKLQLLAKLLRSNSPLDVVCSPGRLAQQCGVSYKNIVTIYRDYKRSEAIVTAAQRLPGIVEGIAIDAETKDAVCTACIGKGTVPTGDGKKREKCLVCEGKGRVMKSGDPVARKQILEMMELAGKGGMAISAPGGQFLISNGESLEDTLRNARQARLGNGGSDGLDRSQPGTIEG